MQEQYLELLKLYYDEWKYRHEHLWKTLVRFFVVIFFTSTLPITIQVFNGAKIPNIPLSLFPITGILLTVFYLWYSLAESLRLQAVNATMTTILQDLFPKYPRAKLTSITDANKTAHPIFYLQIALWVPVFFATIEIIISFSMLILIFTNSLGAKV